LTPKFLSDILFRVLGASFDPVRSPDDSDGSSREFESLSSNSFGSTNQEREVKKLFVGNLPYSANETDVQNFFADAGVAIDSVTVMRDRFTGQARGFGFVEINDDAAALQAVDACHGRDLMGRAVVVNEARPMAPREGGGGGGGGRPPRR
jgi:RNA recognition motif-containing protein